MNDALLALDPSAHTLRTDGLCAVFLPGRGILGASLRHRGEELLARVEDMASFAQSGRTCGIPLLHPWANRFGAMRYRAAARLYRTAAFPAFDLILLGMGDNGHAASLFPGTAALRETARWVVAQYVEVMTTWRVTFSAPLINAARNVAFLAEGAGKAQMMWNVLEGPYQPDVWPSQLIQPVSGELHWLVDVAAAAKVGPRRIKEST